MFNTLVYKIMFFIVATAAMLYPVMPNDFVSSLFPENLNDKVQHATVFFILAWLLNRSSDTKKHRIRNIIVLSIFGIVIELIQYYVPNRTPSVYDALADIVGILLFQFLYTVYLQLSKEKSYYSKP